MALDKVIILEPKGRGRARAAGMVLNEVTPEILRRAKRAAENGEPGALFDVLGFFERSDDEIPSALASLTSAVVQDTVNVIPLEESDEAMRQVEVTDYMLDNLDLHALIEELAMAHYYPARCAQPGWDALGFEGTAYQAPVTYEMLPDWWIYAKPHQGSPYTVVHVGLEPYHSYEKGALLLMTMRKLPSFESIDWTKFGRGFGAARFGIYSWYNLEDWAAYNEVLGIPTVIGTLLDGWGKADKELLQEAVFGITSDSRAVISERTKLDLLERKTNGTALFKEFAEYMSRVKAKILKGESLTDNMGDKGSYAAMRTTNGIRLDIAQKIATKVEKLLNRRLLHPFLDLNFKKRLCEIQIRVRPAPDLAQELRIDESLIRSGVELSVSELRRRYGRSAPKDEDDTLRSGRSQGQSFQPFGGGA